MWQEVRTELHPKGLEIVTVALDTGGPDAVRAWIEAAAPSHPSLIDERHVTDELLGFVNVPMAVWIDEGGTLVRPAQQASPRKSALRDLEVSDDLPREIRGVLSLAKRIPDHSEAYMAALRDWVERGSDSPYALAPDQVVARSQPIGRERAEAAAAFALGQHLWAAGERPAAVPWWRSAHRLDPGNWTYKRQAWSLAITKTGEQTSLLQGPTDEYEGDWVKDVRALGPENYYPPSQL